MAIRGHQTFPKSVLTNNSSVLIILISFVGKNSTLHSASVPKNMALIKQNSKVPNSKDTRLHRRVGFVRIQSAVTLYDFFLPSKAENLLASARRAVCLTLRSRKSVTKIIGRESEGVRLQHFRNNLSG